MEQDIDQYLSRRNLLKLGVGLSVLPWLNACSNQSDFVLDGHVWPGYEFIYMARDLGWLLSSDIDLLPTQSASESMQALRDNRAQAAMLTLDEAIRLCSEGLELNIVLVFNISLGADVVVAKPNIQTFEQLQGKRIGVEESALGALMLHKFLQHAGLDIGDIIPVSVTVDKHLMAWEMNQVDVLITYEPDASKLIKLGGHKLFDSRQMPDMIFDVLVVRSDVLNQQQASLRKLIQSHFKALYHFRTNPMDASHRISKRLGLSAEEVLQLYRGLLLPDALANYAYLSKQDYRLINAANYLVERMKEANILYADCDLREILTNQFIPKEYL